MCISTHEMTDGELQREVNGMQRRIASGEHHPELVRFWQARIHSINELLAERAAEREQALAQIARELAELEERERAAQAALAEERGRNLVLRAEAIVRDWPLLDEVQRTKLREILTPA